MNKITFIYFAKAIALSILFSTIQNLRLRLFKKIMGDI